MMDDNNLEELRQFYEKQFQTKDRTAEAVVVLGYIDYTDHPAIKEYEQRGYTLYDALVFGRGEEWGGIKKKKKRQTDIVQIKCNTIVKSFRPKIKTNS